MKKWSPLFIYYYAVVPFFISLNAIFGLLTLFLQKGGLTSPPNFCFLTKLKMNWVTAAVQMFVNIPIPKLSLNK